MFNDPSVGDVISIDGRSYQFIQVPETPDIVYAELGKKAKIYRVFQGSRAYALKVFKSKYRTERLMANMDLIASYQNTSGLIVAERTVLIPEKYPDLIENCPELAYAILMPWIDGKSWGNYVASRTAITKTESLRLAIAFADVISSLEQMQIAHCDLSGSNFIFSNDFRHVELVDIEEMYRVDFQQPDPIPSGTSGYSPDWVKKNGLWAANADRFSAGIIICEILGWQFEDVRSLAGKGDAFFADGEIGQDSKRYHLLEKHIREINFELAELLQAVWRAQKAKECPRVSNWREILIQLSESSSPATWEWEPLDLPYNHAQNVVHDGELHQRKTLEASPANQHTSVNSGRLQENSAKEHEVILQPWIEGNSRQSLLIKVFLIFASVGAIIFILILGFGDVIVQVSESFREQSGWILPDMVSNGILGLLVGGVHAWIFRRNIRNSHLVLFILTSFLGGSLGGVVTGYLTNIGTIANSYIAGAVTGGIAGSLSSLGQNLFMRSDGMQLKWFTFSCISWVIIWIIGTTISWNQQTISGTASAAALMILLSGASLSAFLQQYPEVEF